MGPSPKGNVELDKKMGCKIVQNASPRSEVQALTGNCRETIVFTTYSKCLLFYLVWCGNKGRDIVLLEKYRAFSIAFQRILMMLIMVLHIVVSNR